MDTRSSTEKAFNMAARVPRGGVLIIVCLVALSSVTRDFQASACDRHTPPSAGTAPVMPSVPEQYSVNVEANILQERWAAEVEEIYDGVNGRAAVKMTINGSTTSSIFDFKTGIQYTILPSGTCKTGHINQTSGMPHFVELYDVAGSKWTSVKEAFRHSDGGNTKYVGKDRIRGIPANHWTICEILTDYGAWLQVDYFFSDPDFDMAYGREQVPLRIMFQTDLSLGHTKLPENWALIPGTTVHHIYELTFFRPGPAIKEEVFKIPTGVTCMDKNRTRPLPTLPRLFQLDIEVVLPGSPMKQGETLTYNKDMQTVETVRQVLLRSPDDPGQFIRTRVTTIEDFGNRIIFIVKEMNCSILAMDNAYAVDIMSHGLNLYYTANGMLDFSYKGMTEIRGLLVDVWQRKKVGITMEIYYLAKEADGQSANEKNTGSQGQTVDTPVGMLLKNDGDVNRSDVPLLWKQIFYPWLDDQDRPDDPKLSNNRSMGTNVKEKYVHFYNFDIPDNPVHHQMSKCFPEKEKSVALIIVDATMEDISDQWKTASLALKKAIVESTGVSIIQVSAIRLDYYVYSGMNNCVAIFMELLGSRPGLPSTFLPLRTANRQIKKAVQDGLKFKIHYSNLSKEFSVLFYDSWLSTVSENASIPAKCNATLGASNRWKDTLESYTKFGKPSSGRGNQSIAVSNLYSPSTVAGIAFTALLMGVLLCLAGVYILYKRRCPEQAFMFFKMTQ